MVSESVKKVQEILFRGGSPPDSRPESVAESRPDIGLTIRIPKPIPPISHCPPPKANRSSPDSSDASRPGPFREELQENLGDKYRGAEKYRLEEDQNGEKQWKKWGPYVSDRQWVRSSFVSVVSVVR